MAQDWKDMLASLNMPDSGHDEPETPTATDTADEKNSMAQTETLHVVLDKKGRKGKVATIIEGFTIDDEDLQQLASELKRMIGTGGSARGGEILLQGNWVEKTKNILKDKKFRVK